MTTISPNAKKIQLSKPTDNNVTLLQALKDRHSTRDFSNKEVTDEDLSTILWAACGFNRPESGMITAPSAMNSQDVVVFVFRKDGAFRYEPKDNCLVKVSEKNLRSLVNGPQPFESPAPLAIVIASNNAKLPESIPAPVKARLGAIDAGYVSENICLACSALGLSTVPRMTMDTDGLKKELNLDNNFDLVLNNLIGYSKI